MTRQLPTYINNYPKDLQSYWSDKLQGVSHSDDHWFFTQLTKLHKFPVTSDLQKDHPDNSKLTRMPNDLVTKGYDHFGDPDYVKSGDQGYIFIPVEGKHKDPVLAVFRDDDGLSFVGYHLLSSQTREKQIGRAGWVAFDPVHQKLHSSNNRISAEFPIYRYTVDFDKLAGGIVSLTPEVSLVLTNADGAAISIGKYIQGGCFSPEGILFIANGKQGDDEKKGGIRAFTADGVYLYKSVTMATNTNSFVYAYRSDWRHNEEPEGITFWDIDQLGAPRISGQLHAILLDNDPGRDGLYFKHYGVPR